MGDAKILARLGTELYYADDGARSERLPREAVKIAKDCDPALLAYALSARHFVSQRPHVHPLERLPRADRAVGLVSDGPVCDVLALALQHRILDRLELGDRAGFEADVDRYARVVDVLDQPFFGWIRALCCGTRALLAGRIQEAERAAHAALELGRRIGSPNALVAFAGQLLAVRQQQGRLAELVPVLRDVVRAPDALPAYRAALAAATAVAGDTARAREALDAVVVPGLEDLPRDQNWPGVLAVLALAAARDARHAARVRELLRSFSGRLVVAGYGAVVLGAADHQLGVLSAALGDLDAATQYFDAAEDLHRRLEAPLLIAATQRASQGILDDARGRMRRSR